MLFKSDWLFASKENRVSILFPIITQTSTMISWNNLRCNFSFLFFSSKKRFISSKNAIYVLSNALYQIIYRNETSFSDEIRGREMEIKGIACNF